MDSGKSLSVQSGCFPFQNPWSKLLQNSREPSCLWKSHSSYGQCTAAIMWREIHSLSRMDAAPKMMPLPREKVLFIFKLFTFSLKYSVPAVWRISKKNMWLSFHFCSYGKGCILLIQNGLYVSKSKVWKWFRFPKRSREELVPKSVSFASKQNSSKVFEEKNLKT